MLSVPHSRIMSKNYFAGQKKKRLYFILVSIYTSTKVKSKRGERKTFGKQTIFSFGQHRYNTLHHLLPLGSNHLNNHEHHHRQNAMQHIPYIPKYTSNQPFKNDFAQSFSLAFIIRKNALILYPFSEEKEVQNGLFYHFIYKILVVNWSNMLRREIIGDYQRLAYITID